MSGTTIEQDRIEADLKTTRSRLDRRLNELQGKLAPGQLVEDLLDYVRGNRGGEFGRNLLDSVQKNPVPAVVAGIGLAWLMASNGRGPAAATSGVGVTSRGAAGVTTPYYPPYSTPTFDDGHLEQMLAEAEAGVHRTSDDTDSSYADRLQDARGKVVGVARNAQETAASFADRVKAAISSSVESMTRGSHDLRDKAGSTASQIKDSAQTYGGQARDAAQNIGGKVLDSAGQIGGQVKGAASQVGGQILQGAKSAQQSGADLFLSISANPIALGALGAAAGALLGLLLPNSEQEEAALSGVATQARGAARDLAQAAVDQGSSVAQAVVGKAKESAAAHGFTSGRSLDDVAGELKSGSLVDNAKQVVQEVLDAGHQAIQGEKPNEPPAANPA